MKILVFGAGVLGSYLCHVLCENGHGVDLLARGKRFAEVEHGLVIEHRLQKITTTDHPHAISEAPANAHYDAVFTVMQYGQTKAALETIANIDTPLLVIVGNNMCASCMERQILEHDFEHECEHECLLEHGFEHGAQTEHAPETFEHAGEKTVLFGFSATAGRHENGKVICFRQGSSHLTCGAAGREAPAAAKTTLDAIFTGEYKPSWQPDMDAWLKCHAAFILPLAYLCYANGCDLRRSTGVQRRLCLAATAEAFDLLKLLSYPILPEGEEEYYHPGAKMLYMRLFMLVMAKTKLGKLAAADHCRAAVAEMRELDAAFAKLRRRKPGFGMPAWEKLRKSAPSWDELEKIYAKSK